MGKYRGFLYPFFFFWLVNWIFTFAGVDAPAEDLMHRRPRDPHKGIFSLKKAILVTWQGLCLASVTLFLYLMAYMVEGYPKPLYAEQKPRGEGATYQNEAQTLVRYQLSLCLWLRVFVAYECSLLGLHFARLHAARPRLRVSLAVWLHFLEGLLLEQVPAHRYANRT